MNIHQIEAEVLSLPIAEALIASLDEDTEIERAWDVEVARRWAEIEAGTVQTVSGDEFVAKVRGFLR